jgi:glycosyltransferase involved in cell wall biosynthesis
VLKLPLAFDGIGAEELALAISSELGEEVRIRMHACGLPWTGQVPTDGLSPDRTPPFLEGRELALLDAPQITVAICTRNRPEALARVLASLCRQEYPAMRVLVVDNAPLDDSSQRVSAEYASRLDLSYVVEARPGLSRARNRAIEASDSDIIAWVDDDAECDRWWLAELARGFFEHPGADAVSGMVLPAEIETPAQLWFERYGGHSKGRGFTPDVFRWTGRATQSPMYPLPPFGAGASMAFRREAIERIGRFDCALGAGAPTLAGEDIAAFSTVLFLGGTVIWQPSALIRHWHRREHEELRKMFHGYGRGLGAFYASMVVRHPQSLTELVRLIPRALRDLNSPDGARLADVGEDFPRDLLETHRIGLLQGPAMYVYARLAATQARLGAGR